MINADQISHRLSEPGASGYNAIVSHFGRSFVQADQSLDRKKLGRIVFSDAAEKQKLEEILHPLIQAEVLSLRKKYSDEGIERCFYDVPLLFEKNLNAQFDCVVLVWCDSVTQMDRLIRRSGLTETEALLRMKNQLPLVEKVKGADYCLDNSGSLLELDGQIQNLLGRI